MKALTKIEKIHLIHQLVTLINAGIPASSAVEKIRKSDARVSVFLSVTARRLRMGKSFSASLPTLLILCPAVLCPDPYFRVARGKHVFGESEQPCTRRVAD